MTDRCPWCGTDPLYIAYHDSEWGVPLRAPQALWECLMLEGFQAGLSWITILRRRETFRAAFAGFDPAVIAQWGEPEVVRLLADPGIIRHRGKIEATIKSARAYLAIEAAEGFSPYIWKHVDHIPQQNRRTDLSAVPAQTAASVALSKQLKKDGFGFCGPTITYAFMQAVGMVNDHLVTCPAHDRVAALGVN